MGRVIDLTGGGNWLWKLWYFCAYYLIGDRYKPEKVSLCGFFWRGVFGLIGLPVFYALLVVLHTIALLFNYKLNWKDLDSEGCDSKVFIPVKHKFMRNRVGILQLVCIVFFVYLYVHPFVFYDFQISNFNDFMNFVLDAKRPMGFVGILSASLYLISTIVSFLVMFIVLVIFGFSRLLDCIKNKRRKIRNSDGPIASYARAIKKKICPIIEFKR